MIEIITLICIGLFSGIVSGMTGASGVMLLIPVLTSFFGFSLFKAIGTSLLADVLASGPIAGMYYRSGNFDIKSALILSLGAIIGAQFGSSNVTLLPENLLMIAFSISMIALGIRMVRGNVRSPKERPVWLRFSFLQNTWVRIGFSFLIGILLGIMTGFFGAGGGIIVFLILYFVFKLNIKTSIGTAAGVMLVSTISGSWGYWQMGNIDLRIGLIVGISAMVGGIASAYLANHLDEDTLSHYVGILFIILAMVMLGIRFVL